MPRKISVEYNQVPQRALTIWEKYQIAELLSQYPALTLKVWMHRRVGLRRADPIHIGFMAVFMMAIGAATGGVLAAFGAATGLVGFWQHRCRWKELRRGARWHTYSDGVSPIEDFFTALLASPPVVEEAEEGAEPPKPFSRVWWRKGWHKLKARLFKPSPEVEGVDYKKFSLEWWLSDLRIYRILEPTLAYIVGAAIALGSLYATFKVYPLFVFFVPLGAWIMFAAICLMADQQLAWRHHVKDILDEHDAMLDAAVLRGRRGSGRRSGRQLQPRRDTFGLPTGIGDDIRERVQAQAALQAAAEAKADAEAQDALRLQQLEERIREREARMPDAPQSHAPDNLAI